MGFADIGLDPDGEAHPRLARERLDSRRVCFPAFRRHAEGKPTRVRDTAVGASRDEFCVQSISHSVLRMLRMASVS